MLGGIFFVGGLITIIGVFFAYDIRSHSSQLVTAIILFVGLSLGTVLLVIGSDMMSNSSCKPVDVILTQMHYGNGFAFLSYSGNIYTLNRTTRIPPLGKEIVIYHYNNSICKWE